MSDDNDDFLSDLNSAIDNGGKAPVEPVAVPVTPASNDGVGTGANSDGGIANSINQPAPDPIQSLNNLFDESDKALAETYGEASSETTNPSKTDKNNQQNANNSDDSGSDSDGNAAAAAGDDNKNQQTPATSESEANRQNYQSASQQNRTTSLRQQEKLLDTFLNADDDGNLVNADGEIIALAGKSRDHFSKLKNEGRRQRQAATDLALKHIQLSDQFKKLYDEYKGLSNTQNNPIQSIVRETGLSETDAQSMIQIAQQYKTNPIEAIKNLLTQAQMNGIDISQIGANVSASPDFMRKTLETMLDERLAPLNEKHQRENAQAEADAEAAQFLQQFPEAGQFHEYIGEAKMRYPEMSLSEIWLRIKLELAKTPNTPNTNPSTEQNQSQQSNDNALSQRRQQGRGKLRANIAQQKAAKKIIPPVVQRDYSNMSFDEIAASILKDNS